MLSYEQITDLLRQTGLPFAYHHFSDRPDNRPFRPPFLVYLTPGSHNFSADGMVYYRVDQLDIELYTDKKQPEQEAKLEAVLDEAGLFYNKTEQFIRSEQLYEVLYEMEV